MPTKRLALAAALPDAALLSRIRELALHAREAVADLVAHLAELDARRLYLDEGYGSLFAYCTSALRLSEHGAYNRIEAARAARKFPAILDPLAAGSVNLATVRLLAPHLTAENHHAVLAQAEGRSKREVELLVTRLAPLPDPPSAIRKLPAAAQVSSAGRDVRLPDAVPASPASLPSVPPWQPKPVLIAPLSPWRYRLQFTVGKEIHDRLRHVQDLLRREIPGGDLDLIFDRALVLLVDQIERRKLGATSHPRSAAPVGRDSRQVPAAVKRAVWKRDGGRCAFIASNGHRCEQRAFLEFHHVKPWAAGGPATVENISLRCRQHNAFEAERFFDRQDTQLAPGRVAAQSPVPCCPRPPAGPGGATSS